MDTKYVHQKLTKCGKNQRFQNGSKVGKSGLKLVQKLTLNEPEMDLNKLNMDKKRPEIIKNILCIVHVVYE